MNAVTIRAATAADLPRVEQLLRSQSLPVDGVAGAIEHFVVADVDGALAGVAGTERCGAGEYALLRSVAVVDEYKGKGFGRALVTRAIADAEAHGAHALYLLTTTAERYFPSFGFRQVERDTVPSAVAATVEFTSACPASAVVMRRDAAR